MVNSGIWVLWRHELPPENATVEIRFSDEEAAIYRGTRCRRGCCFFDEQCPDNALVTPKWWRLPEPQPAEPK